MKTKPTGRGVILADDARRKRPPSVYNEVYFLCPALPVCVCAWLFLIASRLSLTHTHSFFIIYYGDEAQGPLFTRKRGI